MESIPEQFPISLRAWPSKDEKTVPLPSLITRINNERGSFRSVTEESLEEEIVKGEAGVDDNEDGDGSDDDGGEEELDQLKELSKSREEILAQLEQAHNASMVTLDFVSLLLSKDTPVQASLSISPALRDAVALGTLGVDKVHDSRVTNSQKQDNRLIAKGWKLQSLTETVDSILASASRLEKEIEKETKYWEQVLTVSDKGWAICRLPQEKHTLGVRFGFAESAPAFHNRSLGALRRNIDGSIYLDQGITDAAPKRVRVRIQTDGIITGEQLLAIKLPVSASVESLILAARNTIYEEELWQELSREARVLTNQGVRIVDNQILCPITPTKRIMLDLQLIGSCEIPSRSEEKKTDNEIAEMISLALHLLLSYAHRQNHRRRSQPPAPISSRSSANIPHSLLRPIVARLHHESIISNISGLLAHLSKALISTGLSESLYTCTTPSITSAIATRSQAAKLPPHIPEQIIDALISNLSAEFTQPLTQSKQDPQAQTLTIRLRTALFPLETRFQIAVSGRLATMCKPPPNPSSVDEVKVYILWATACAIAGTFINVGDEKEDEGTDAAVGTEESELSGARGWRRTHNPVVLRKTFHNEKDSKELRFKATAVNGVEGKQEVQIIAAYKYVFGNAEDGVGVQLHQAGDGGKIKDKGLLNRVWRSDDLTRDRNGTEAGNKLSLEQFVQEVGRWDGPMRGEGEYGFGEGYNHSDIIWDIE